jgi:hypothetical protein
MFANISHLTTTSALNMATTVSKPTSDSAVIALACDLIRCIGEKHKLSKDKDKPVAHALPKQGN